MARIVKGKPGIRDGVVVDTSKVDTSEGGVNLGLVGSAEQVFEETLTSEEAKRVAYAPLLAADGIKPRA